MSRNKLILFLLAESKARIISYLDINAHFYKFTKFSYDRLSYIHFDYWDVTVPDESNNKLIQNTLTNVVKSNHLSWECECDIAELSKAVKLDLEIHFSFWSYIENGQQASEEETFDYYDPDVSDDPSLVHCPICR